MTLRSDRAMDDGRLIAAKTTAAAADLVGPGEWRHPRREGLDPGPGPNPPGTGAGRPDWTKPSVREAMDLPLLQGLRL
jgi:hypothetical protein